MVALPGDLIHSLPQAPEFTGSIPSRSKTGLPVIVSAIEILPVRSRSAARPCSLHARCARRPRPEIPDRAMPNDPCRSLMANAASRVVAPFGFTERMCSGSPMMSRSVASSANRRQFFRIARQQRRKRRESIDARGAQPPNRLPAARQSGAQCGSYSLRISSRLVVMRKTHSQRGGFRQFHQFAQDPARSAGRASESQIRGRMRQQFIQNARHHRFRFLGRLIRIHQRRTINHLIRSQLAPQQFRRIRFESRELPQCFQSSGLSPPYNPHGGDIAIVQPKVQFRAGRERMRESGLRDKPSGGAKHAFRFGVKHLERHC